MSDLFKKKFDYKNQVQLKNKSKTGLVSCLSRSDISDAHCSAQTFTSTGGATDKGVSGSLNIKYKQDSFGEVETEVDTAGKAKVDVKAKKLAKGVVVSVKCVHALE